VTRALWLLVVALLAAALPLGAQPKLVVNAQVDTRSAAAGLDQVFRNLPASAAYWVGYSVPAVRAANLGCLTSQGVVHLEPPDQAAILLRVEAGAVGKILALSPYCEIDAGGVPVHWLTDVKPDASVAFLATFAPDSVWAIAVHADPAADIALERFAAPGQPQSLRLRTVSLLGSTRGRRGMELLTGLITNEADAQVRQRAISALASVADGAGIPVLIQLAKTTQDGAVRKQAMNSLGQSRDPRAVSFFEDILKPGN
jgi:HEAT repeats